jgi:predicted nuclease of predicted toxin-antitoxin system
MSRPRFLADHDFNEHIIRGVQRLEPTAEFLRVREIGMEEASDPVILEFAATQQLIVLSHDVNTMRAAANARLEAGQPFSGLFLVHQRDPLNWIIPDLVLIWNASEGEEWAGQVNFLPLKK